MLKLFRSAQLAGNVPASVAYTVCQDAHDPFMPLVSKLLIHAKYLPLSALHLQMHVKVLQSLVQQQTCEVVVGQIDNAQSNHT